MPPPFVAILILSTLPAFAWVASEFYERRWLRITLGSLAILSSVSIAILVGMAERFNSNAWFGGAMGGLVNATVAELEAGNVDGVLKSLKTMQQDYRPTYENRARFDVLCDEAVARMKVRTTPSP